MTVVKICGLRTPEHALASAAAGAELLGFIFAPSRRQVEAQQVITIRAALAEAGYRPELVGVFVNSPAAVMREIADHCGLDILQLSGDEPPGILAALPGRRVIKALRLAGHPDEEQWLRPGPHHDHVRLHIDAHVPGSYGGAGVIANWERAADLARRLPIILAGGLTSDNVAAALAQVGPWGVDVSSGVETDGIKDNGKIRAFIAAVRAAERAQ